MSHFKKIEPSVLLSVLFACVVTVIAACGGSSAPTGTSNIIETPATVAVRVDSTTLLVGHLAHASGMPADAMGHPIDGQVISWASLTPDIASVSSSGDVTAVASGPAIIQASVSGVTGLDTLVVVALPNLASNDFENGTLAGSLGTFQFLYQAGRLTVVDDPTRSGHGKVAQFFYSPIVSNPSDDEVINPSIATNPRPVPIFRYGYTLWFRGDVYFPSTNSTGIIHNHNNRKFLDYKGNATRMTLHRRRDDNTGFGTNSEDPADSHSAVHMSIVRDVNGTGIEVMDPDCGITLNDDTWYTVEVMVHTNSASGVNDGVVEIYMNGAVRPTFRQTGLSWFSDADTNSFNFLMIGSQLTESSSDLFSEYRYWDNVGFSTTRIGR
jgi:hypothetical protein